MYSTADYGAMIADSSRTDVSVEALRQVVQPETVVLDIGTGTGIFALLACQFGARKVYAIEPSDVIQVAREIAAANGYAERIEFFQKMSTQVTFPERADVIISDLRGVLPFFQNHIPSIVDARQRHLAPDGILIPKQDTLWAAVVEAPKLYSTYSAPWDDDPYGFDMQTAKSIVFNTWGSGSIKPEQLLVSPQSWGTLDYMTVENPDIDTELTWTMERAGTSHGFIVWFDAILVEGIGFSNAPGKPELIYGNSFFPWLKPVALAIGDQVTVSLAANLVNGSYIWRWNARVLSQGNPEQVKAEYQQSTFFGVPVSMAQLRKHSSRYIPTLDEKAQIDLFILKSMDGETSVGEIAHRVLEQFPTQFDKREDALNSGRRTVEKVQPDEL